MMTNVVMIAYKMMHQSYVETEGLIQMNSVRNQPWTTVMLIVR